MALKILRSTHSTDRFRREMELVQRLAHPNVVIAYGVGEDENVLYIVMELLSGPDLHQYVSSQGPLEWKRSLDVILDAARGLEHAHSRGLIHRDVKPGNLIFDGGQITKIADLGLAALSVSDDEATVDGFSTLDGMAAGTPDFMAPEQARSLSSATEASDVYSLGATWFYLLTGQSRVVGDTLGEKLSVLRRATTLKPLCHDVAPTQVREVWERMVAYRPQERYRSMTEVVAALESIRPSSAGPAADRGVDVLIIEDNQDDLMLMMELLRRSNKSVTAHAAHSVSEGIQCLRDLPHIDVVLLDLQLPDSVGVDTVRKIKTAAKQLPIIVLTGHEDVRIGEACIAAGADDFASKNHLTVSVLERRIFITLSRRNHADGSVDA